MRKRTPVITAFLTLAVYLAWSFGVPALEREQAERVSADFPNTGELSVPITDSGKEGMVPGGHVDAKVTGIVDGDTIDVEYKNEEYKVRLLCIDTPESVKSGVKPQTYGKEASGMTEKLAGGRQVELVFDKGLRDKYGRLLAFVMLENGKCLNALLVYKGYARVEIVSPNRTYKDWFHKLQDVAIEEKSGMWALPEKEQPFVKNGKGEYVPRYWGDEAAS